MSQLGDVRAALGTALEGLGLNVSGGDDITPPGASIGAFTVQYHASVGGKPIERRRALCNVRVVSGQAHEPSAYAAMDEALSDVPRALETATGPWLTLLVQGGGPSEPLSIGEATYTAALLSVEIFL